MVTSSDPPLSAGEFFFTEGCFITELSNSAVDPDVSIARARVRPGDVTRWHSLSATIERYVILEGTGRVEVGKRDAQLVHPGDVVIIPAGVKQRIHNVSREDLVFLAICSPRFELKNYQDLEGDIQAEQQG